MSDQPDKPKRPSAKTSDARGSAEWRPEDRIEMLGGIINLPAEFREVARLANLAGLAGYAVETVEIGIDPKAFYIDCDIRSWATISYYPKAAMQSRDDRKEGEQGSQAIQKGFDL